MSWTEKKTAVINGKKMTWVEAGAIRAPIATRVNADGTVSIVSVGPGIISLEAEIGEQDGLRTLTARDSQHEYVYVEAD